MAQDAEDHRAEIMGDEGLSTTSFARRIALTGLMQAGADGRELGPNETRGALDGLTEAVLEETSA